MKIDIALIPPEGLEISQQEDASVLELNTPDVEFSSPLTVGCRAIRIADNINVSGLFQANVKFRCSRCIENFSSEIRGKFNFDCPIKEKTILDITDNVRQEVILSYPSVLLCKKNCRGLCPRCGQNLNKEKCGCGAATINSKLSKLKEWKG